MLPPWVRTVAPVIKMPPPAEPSLLALNVILPPCVERSTPEEATMSLLAIRLSWSLVLTVTSLTSSIFPPKTVMGPATVRALANVMLALLPALPRVRPVKVLPKFQPAVLNASVKLLVLDSMRRAPEPAKVLLMGLGASFCKTNVPALMVVVPL